MKKRIQSLCPCGFSELLGDMTEAVASIQLHFELFHKDLLPFGLTEKEALELLTVSNEREIFYKSISEKKSKNQNLKIQVSV